MAELAPVATEVDMDIGLNGTPISDITLFLLRGGFPPRPLGIPAIAKLVRLGNFFASETYQGMLVTSD